MVECEGRDWYQIVGQDFVNTVMKQGERGFFLGGGEPTGYLATEERLCCGWWS